VGPGTLYRTLKHLLGRGLLDEVSSTSKGKRTYRITTAGRQVASLEARRLAELVKWASDVRLLKGRP
ncbi:MAG: PadR family transcriptional regulator, partial [Longimicrobiales bacterium]